MHEIIYNCVLSSPIIYSMRSSIIILWYDLGTQIHKLILSELSIENMPIKQITAEIEAV